MTGSEYLALISSRGTDDDGVTAYAFDPGDGSLSRLGRTAVESPGYLAAGPDGDVLVATNRVDGGRISSYRIDRTDGSLERLSGQSSEGEGPCYVSVDATGRYAFVTNYYGGTVAMLPVDESGALGPASHVVSHEDTGPHPERQADPHPHCLVPGPENRLAYVTDLASDRIAVYRIDFEAGRLDAGAVPDARLEPESGPRHLAFGPDGRFAYVVNELDSTITALARDPETGALEPVDTASTLPADAAVDNKVADVHVHPTGRWVYASNRGHDSVAAFEADGGDLRPLGHEPTGGEWPRDFALDPTGGYLLAENSASHEVVHFRIDAERGGLEPTGERTAQRKPSCAVFIERA